MRYIGYKIIELEGKQWIVGGRANSEEELAGKGYLPIEKTEMPKDGKRYRPVYAEADGVIRQTWEEFVPVSKGVSE